jgi:hypothetical protein
MAVPVFGSTTGPIYDLGLITVASSGTPVALNTNVAITTSFGSSTSATNAGLPASPAPICANQVMVMAPSTNSGDIQLVWKTQGASSGNGVSVILNVPKGQMVKLESPQLSNPFQIDRFGIDGTTNDKAYVTLVIV